MGGTVTGVRGTGLVLQDNSGNDLTLTGNGTFTFSSGIDQGGAYSVTVKTQPSGANLRRAQRLRHHRHRRHRQRHRHLHIAGALRLRGEHVPRTPSPLIAIDASTGALTPIAGSPFASTGTTPVAAVVDPNGAYLYVANNGSNTVRCTPSTTPPARSRRRESRSRRQRTVRPAGRPLRPVPLRHQQDRQHGLGVRDRERRSAHRHRRLAVRGGQEPTSLATDPGGNFLYVTDYAERTSRRSRSSPAAAARRDRRIALWRGRGRAVDRHRSDRHLRLCRQRDGALDLDVLDQYRYRGPCRAVRLARSPPNTARIARGRSGRPVPVCRQRTCG